MTDWSPSRRTVLQAGGAIGAAALAGCLGDGGDGATVDPDAPIDLVPAGSQFVIHADVATLLNDDQLRSRLNELLGAAGEQNPLGASDVQSALDRVESGAGLDPRALQTLTLFGGFGPEAPSGIRFEADWEAAALREAVGGGIEPETETYKDRSLYRYGETTVLGVLEDRQYVTGTAAGVEATIDVIAGDADPVAGSVREAFGAAPDGPLRFGFEVPETPDDGADGTGGFDPSTFGSVTRGYGGYVIDGDARSGSITLETADDEAAESVAAELRSARDGAQERFDSAETDRELAAEFGALLSSLTVGADGSSVVVSVADGEIFPVALLAVLGSFLLGLGSQQQVRSPQAVFDFEYDSAGELTVTHQGGDNVGASQLVIQGQGLGTTGTWSDLGGSASGDLDAQPAVVAGDSVTVAAEPDYEVRVIWQRADGSTSAVLASNRGPAA